jgi:hypothetical protein
MTEEQVAQEAKQDELGSVLDKLKGLCGEELGVNLFCGRKKGHERNYHSCRTKVLGVRATMQFPIKGENKR